VTHYGLVAEEVAAVYPELVTRTATGEVQTVKAHRKSTGTKNIGIGYQAGVTLQTVHARR